MQSFLAQSKENVIMTRREKENIFYLICIFALCAVVTILMFVFCNIKIG